ncbi:MAG: metallophosphoesterase [Oligoflexales bacterium]
MSPLNKFSDYVRPITNFVNYSKSLFLFLIILSTSALAKNPNTPKLKVLAFGDFGEVTRENQMIVKKLIAKDHLNYAYNLGIVLGDNFYPYGVDSVDDPQFIEKFVDIYQDLNFPFFPVLGNHDYGCHGVDEFGDWKAQINFSNHVDNPRVGDLRLWNMPSRFYNFNAGKDVEFFAIDTDPALNSRFNKFEDSGLESKSYWDQQMDWLSDKLKNSKSIWKVVYGHHPLISDGKNNDTQELLGVGKTDSANLFKILCESADMYIAGHEHSLQVFNLDCGHIHKDPLPQIVSGAAGNHSMARQFYEKRSDFQSNALGFISLIFSEKTISAEVNEAINTGAGPELKKTQFDFKNRTKSNKNPFRKFNEMLMPYFYN